MSRQGVIRIYIDTNVLINYCTGQKSDVESLNYVFSKRRKEILFTSTLALAQTVANLQTKKKTRKPFSKQNVVDVLSYFSTKLTVVSFTPDDITNAISENGSDMEDCIHTALARKVKCNAILTNNISDFTKFDDVIVMPSDLSYLKTFVK